MCEAQSQCDIQRQGGMLAIELTEGLAKIAAGSILVTALIALLAVLGRNEVNVWLRGLTVVLGIGVVLVAILLFTGNESKRVEQDQRVTTCHNLVSTVRQGLVTSS